MQDPWRWSVALFVFVLAAPVVAAAQTPSRACRDDMIPCYGGRVERPPTRPRAPARSEAPPPSVPAERRAPPVAEVRVHLPRDPVTVAPSPRAEEPSPEERRVRPVLGADLGAFSVIGFTGSGSFVVGARFATRVGAQLAPDLALFATAAVAFGSRPGMGDPPAADDREWEVALYAGALVELRDPTRFFHLAGGLGALYLLGDVAMPAVELRFGVAADWAASGPPEHTERFVAGGILANVTAGCSPDYGCVVIASLVGGAFVPLDFSL